MKTKIYYVMDTMCGWCYGFSDVITEIQEKYKSVYDLDRIFSSSTFANESFV